MTAAEKLFHDIAAALPDAKEGKMFGALNIKAPNGKAAAMFWRDKTAAKNEFMVFKLTGKPYDDAMALNGAKVFDPMDGRPMKGWVQLSTEHMDQWKALAKKAMTYVKELEK